MIRLTVVRREKKGQDKLDNNHQLVQSTGSGQAHKIDIWGIFRRGVTEHFGVPVIDVDMIMVSLENAIASTGGFCAGRSFVVGHQRLSGLGYCFSASLPPLLATAASEALRIMAAEPERFEQLQSNASTLHHGLLEACQGTCYALSPLQHIIYKSALHSDSNLEHQDSIQIEEDQARGEKKLNGLVDELFNVHGIVVTRARYLVREEAFAAKPSVKVMCSSELSEQELNNALHKIKEAIKKKCLLSTFCYSPLLQLFKHHLLPQQSITSNSLVQFYLIISSLQLKDARRPCPGLCRFLYCPSCALLCYSSSSWQKHQEGKKG
uniref:Serine palmitoyltransferase 1 n=1 Tax=Ditylenchus dipsaci TaxID=166011 RepID=A0A915CP59_9BILA